MSITLGNKMKKNLCSIAILAVVISGCTTLFHEQVVIHNARDIENHVGEQVVIIGKLIDHKRPMVHEVCVGWRDLNYSKPPDNYQDKDLGQYVNELMSNHAVVHKKVLVKGVLVRVNQDLEDPFSRIPGTNMWYELIDPWTGDLSKYQVIEE